jgi:NAD-dependent DNA ligase
MKILELINNIKSNLEILYSLDKKNYDKLLKYLDDKYYNSDEILISDQLYDYIKEYYEKNIIKSNRKNVGSDVTKNKVKLPYYMGSLDKIKPSTSAFDKWINIYPGPYVLSCKLDGISALLYKINNKIYLYTRGNGIEGQDISYLLEYLNINDKKLINGDAIRGELIISKKNFIKISNVMSNARNAVTGIINSKIPNKEHLKLIDFVPYWTVYPELKSSEQLKYIESKNFIVECVDYKIKKNITIDILSEYLLKYRKDYIYEIDGIVVIDDSKIYPLISDQNPEYGFAFKQILTDQIAESVVIDVIWEISKDKYIKPKIKIDTVELLGSMITYATAFNAKYIEDNKIGPGAIVKIIKSGDVIPHILEIIKPSDANIGKFPDIKYIWNETGIDIIAIDLNKDNMDKLITKKLTYFFSSLNIDFMGEGTVSKFVVNGYDDIWKILSADKTQLYNIVGLGKRSIDKIYESINNKTNNCNLYDIMSASQIFGRGFGSRKFKLITDTYPNILEIYKQTNRNHILELLNNINGFDIKTSTKFIDHIDEFIEYLNKFLIIKPNLLIKNTIKNKIIVDNKLSKYKGKTIVFTGFRDKDIEKKLEEIGATVKNTISGNTDILVTSDITGNSSKIVKAKQLNITILSKDDFYKN